ALITSALDSFPTRRSSDLVAQLVRVEREGGGLDLLEDLIHPRELVFTVIHFQRRVFGEFLDEFAEVLAVLGALERGVRLGALGRSEEHTSELQSLRHLVCR